MIRASTPRHVAIIMDGNNRWAKKRLLPGIAGHKAGVDSVRAVIEVCMKSDVEVLSLFAFSSENWKRPVEEVGALMELFLIALRHEVKKLREHGIRLKVIGDCSRFAPELQAAIRQAEDSTAEGQRLLLQVAANYGGQWDIADAVRRMAIEVREGALQPDEVTTERVAAHLSTAGVPDPDLCIRTGGEQRISNFFLWQMAYAELYFSPLFWPDFRQDAMEKALDAFAQRKRRFGKTDDQVDAEARLSC